MSETHAIHCLQHNCLLLVSTQCCVIYLSNKFISHLYVKSQKMLLCENKYYLLTYSYDLELMV